MNRDELAAGLAPTPLYRYADVVDDELFVAGQVPLDSHGEQVGLGDPAMQTNQCLDNLRTVVETHGFATTDIRQITIHVVGEHQNLLDAWDAMTSWWNSEVPPATLLGASCLWLRRSARRSRRPSRARREPVTTLAANEFEMRALELAWRSCKAGTIGVGALLVKGDGEVLAEGNNAIFAAADAGPLENSRIAHAEMNVFAQITASTDLTDATLYTSLEPCPMCAGATILHDVANVRVLAKDLMMHDLDAIGDRNEWVRDRWVERSFATDPAVVRLATLFASHSMHFWFGETHAYVKAQMAADPETAAWIATVVKTEALLELAAVDAALDDVISALV